MLDRILDGACGLLHIPPHVDELIYARLIVGDFGNRLPHQQFAVIAIFTRPSLAATSAFDGTERQ
jgi:hypothetical protein